MTTKFTTKTSNPDPVYVTEKDGQRVRVWSADGKLDHVIDDDVRAWIGGKLSVTTRSGLEFVHKKYLGAMISRGDLRRDDRDIGLVWVTEQAVARYNLPALSTVKPAKVVAERISALASVATVTESDKIAAAKRALEAVRADQEALRRGIEEPSPVDGLAVRLYVDDAKVGCGERSFLVRDIGKSVVRLFYPALLTEIAVDRLTFDRHAKPYKTTAAKLHAWIDCTATGFDKANIEYNPKLVRAAFTQLAAAA